MTENVNTKTTKVLANFYARLRIEAFTNDGSTAFVSIINIKQG